MMMMNSVDGGSLLLFDRTCRGCFRVQQFTSYRGFACLNVYRLGPDAEWN